MKKNQKTLCILFLSLIIFCSCNSTVNTSGDLAENLPVPDVEMIDSDAAKVKSGGIERSSLKFAETPEESPTLAPTTTPTKAPSLTPVSTKTATLTKTVKLTHTPQPSPTATEAATLEPDESGCPSGCTEQKPGCDIKGNISVNSKEKIYHMPGQQNYDQTIISPEKDERWFCTEAEAVANGWRKAKR